MPPKMRPRPGIRVARSAQKKGRYIQSLGRNITRWSANKDIALLCALAKECRKDKFRISWHRVAKWIGPNVTGGAIEQHVQKLYTKLKEHRHSREPKRKKRKTGIQADEEDVDGDYVEDEDLCWDKGNEAFANMFYDKPEAGMTMHETGSDLDDAEYSDQLHHDQLFNAYQAGDDDFSNTAQALTYANAGYLSQGPYYGGHAEAQSSLSNSLVPFSNQGDQTQSSLVPLGYKFTSPKESVANQINDESQYCSKRSAAYQYDDEQKDHQNSLGSPIDLAFRDGRQSSSSASHHGPTSQQQLDASNQSKNQFNRARTATPGLYQADRQGMTRVRHSTRENNTYGSDGADRNPTYAPDGGSFLPEAESCSRLNPYRGRFNAEGLFSSTYGDLTPYQLRHQSLQHRGSALQYGQIDSVGKNLAPAFVSTINPMQLESSKVKLEDVSLPAARPAFTSNPPSARPGSTPIMRSVEEPNIKKEPGGIQEFGGRVHEEPLFFDPFVHNEFGDE